MNFKEYIILNEDLKSKMPFFVKQYKKRDEKLGMGDFMEPREEKAYETWVSQANSADPTGERANYTQWIVNLDVKEVINLPEDIDKIKEALTTFDRIKKMNIPIKKDINQYKDFSELAQAIEPYAEETTKGKKERLEKSGYEEVYKDSIYTVLQINTPKASHSLCYHYGAKNWCTKDEKYAEQYLKTGPLYMFLKEDKPYVQAHVESQQLMDIMDRRVKISVFKEISAILDKLNLYFFTYDPEKIMRIKKWEGSLYLSGSKITSLPEGLEVDGALNLNNSKITSLGKGLKVGGFLSLESTNISSLPEGLEVGGFLQAYGTKITSLPKVLKVGSYLDIRNTKIPKNYKIPKGVEVKGKIWR